VAVDENEIKQRNTHMIEELQLQIRQLELNGEGDRFGEDSIESEIKSYKTNVSKLESYKEELAKAQRKYVEAKAKGNAREEKEKVD
jgi:bisphosphoglycerate-dependent phosphoglycerate mutase